MLTRRHAELDRHGADYLAINVRKRTSNGRRNNERATKVFGPQLRLELASFAALELTVRATTRSPLPLLPRRNWRDRSATTAAAEVAMLSVARAVWRPARDNSPSLLRLDDAPHPSFRPAVARLRPVLAGLSAGIFRIRRALRRCARGPAAPCHGCNAAPVTAQITKLWSRRAVLPRSPQTPCPCRLEL